MIKFFRKIRQNLLTDNKFSKYLLYAVGEIVLVVIGILIAVNFNDWNTNRKQTAEIHELLKAFEKDLITSIENATLVLNVSSQKDSLIRLVLNNRLSKEDYENKRFGALILNYNRITTSQENLIKLLNREEQVSSDLQPLLKSLKKYQGLISQYIHSQERLSEYVATQNEFFTDNMVWFRAYWESGDERAVDYFLNDPIYKNKVNFYRVMLINNYATSVAEYRNRAISLLYMLQYHIGINSNYEGALKGIGLLPLKEVDCQDDVILQANSGASFAPLIFNATKDTLDVHLSYLIRDEMDIWTMTLSPNEQLDGDFFAPHYFEIRKNGECLAKIHGGHDYLIIDPNLVE